MVVSINKLKSISLPIQLLDSKLKFILIRMEGKKRFKAPQEEEPYTFNNYSFIDPKLKNWISQGKNYGILTGVKTDYGYLTVIDCDKPELIDFVLNNLPNTFRVLTGSGGYHFYYYTNEVIETKVIKSKGVNLGHIKGPGGHVVGPGSIHKHGHYNVNHPGDITIIQRDLILNVLSRFLYDSTTVKITVSQEINSNDIKAIDSILNFPLTKNDIGRNDWRILTNKIILSTDPAPKDRVGCVCALMNVAQWDPNKILDFLGRFCRWSDFDFEISRKHVEYIFNRYGHSVSTGGKVANRGVFSGDFAPAISVNNPLVEKSYDGKHTPVTGEPKGGKRKSMAKITDHKVYGKFHDKKRYWKIAEKQMIKGNDTIHFLSMESNKVALTESGEAAYIDDYDTMKNITLPKNDLECLKSIGQTILDIANGNNGKKKN